MAYGVIYGMLDKTNYKIYVGQTTNLKQRVRQHKRDNLYVDNAARAHGWENFIIEVLEECETPEQLNEREIFWIAELDCKAPKGYNLTDGGEGTRSPSEETLAKLSAASSGENNPFFGKHHTDKTKSMLSIKNRGNSPFKNLLKEFDERNLSYNTFAEILNLKQHTFTAKMRGKLKFMEKEVSKLVEFFGLPAEYLLARDDGENPVSKRHETPFKNLLNEMDNQNFSYETLAKLLGLTSSTVSMKMSGRRNFTEEDIEKLVNIFGCPVEYLFERADGLAITSEEEKTANRSKAQRANTPFKNLLSEMDKQLLSYAGLAELLGLKIMSVSNKMRGEQDFTAKDIAKLVDIFGCPAEYLLKRDDGLPATSSEEEKTANRSKAQRANTPFKNLLSEMDKQLLSYAGLAELLGLSRSAVSFKMLGSTRFMEKDIAKLVELFGKPADYLMKRDE